MKTYRITFELNSPYFDYKGDFIEMYEKTKTVSIFKNLDNCNTELVAIFNIEKILSIRLIEENE